MERGTTKLITQRGIMTINRADLIVTNEIKEFIISGYNDELKKVTAKINPDNNNRVLVTYEDGKECSMLAIYFNSMIKEAMRERVRQLVLH